MYFSSRSTVTWNATARLRIVCLCQTRCVAAELLSASGVLEHSTLGERDTVTACTKEQAKSILPASTG